MIAPSLHIFIYYEFSFLFGIFYLCFLFSFFSTTSPAPLLQVSLPGLQS